jgi:hypothetical protein
MTVDINNMGWMNECPPPDRAVAEQRLRELPADANRRMDLGLFRDPETGEFLVYDEPTGEFHQILV